MRRGADAKAGSSGKNSARHDSRRTDGFFIDPAALYDLVAGCAHFTDSERQFRRHLCHSPERDVAESGRADGGNWQNSRYSELCGKRVYVYRRALFSRRFERRRACKLVHGRKRGLFAGYRFLSVLVA